MAAAPVAGRRPRDRKAQIAATASALFAAHGFHRVGVDDVAAAVGITGGAMYRHFGTKADLLARTVADALDAFDAAVPVDADGGAVIDRLADLVVEQGHVAALIDREARHLAAPALDAHNVQLRAVLDRLEAAVGEDRPDLDASERSLLARSLLAALASPAYHRATLPAGEAQRVLRVVATAVLRTPSLPASDDHETPERAVVARRASRRESLLAAATERFARHGYQAVTMEDIGAAAGIAGSSIYQHFAGKADLLVAAFNRGAEWLQLGVSQALAGGATPEATLTLVVRSYVDFVLAHTDLISLLLTEAVHLPPEEVQVLRRTQHDYVAEWVSALVEHRPDLSDAEAHLRTHAAIAIVNDVARPGRPTPRPGQHRVLVSLALEALTA